MYSVISVIVDSLPGNTKSREWTRSWTARVRLVHSWAERNGDNQTQEPGSEGMKERRLLQTKALHTHKKGGKKGNKMSGKTNIHESKKNGFEHIVLPAKLLDYFLRSNQSNINQSDKR